MLHGFLLKTLFKSTLAYIRHLAASVVTGYVVIASSKELGNI